MAIRSRSHRPSVFPCGGSHASAPEHHGRNHPANAQACLHLRTGKHPGPRRLAPRRHGYRLGPGTSRPDRPPLLRPDSFGRSLPSRKNRRGSTPDSARRCDRRSARRAQHRDGSHARLLPTQPHRHEPRLDRGRHVSHPQQRGRRRHPPPHRHRHPARQRCHPHRDPRVVSR